MQYPKMLYSGDKESYSSRIVHDEEDEAKFRDIGLVDFVDLPKPQPEETGTPIELSGISEEDYNKLAQERDAGLAILNSVSAMKERIAEIQGDTTPVGSASHSGAHLISLNDLTLAQLQEMAKSKGIEFKVRDSKGTLIELLMDYQDKELASANKTA